MSLNPKLCEPGTKYFMSNMLKECHKFKLQYISFFFNIGMMFLFIAMVGGFLLYRYKGRLTISEVALKNRKKEEYIMSKLQFLSAIRNNNSQDMITNLPDWVNNPEAEILRRKI